MPVCLALTVNSSRPSMVLNSKDGIVYHIVAMAAIGDR